jgi:hypothetical protein
MLYIQFCPGITKNTENVTGIIHSVISYVSVRIVPCVWVSLGIVVHRVFISDVSTMRLHSVKEWVR